VRPSSTSRKVAATGQRTQDVVGTGLPGDLAIDRQLDGHDVECGAQLGDLRAFTGWYAVARPLEVDAPHASHKAFEGRDEWPKKQGRGDNQRREACINDHGLRQRDRRPDRDEDRAERQRRDDEQTAVDRQDPPEERRLQGHALHDGSCIVPAALTPSSCAPSSGPYRDLGVSAAHHASRRALAEPRASERSQNADATRVTTGIARQRPEQIREAPSTPAAC
jgi:hypothetical protein